MEQAENTSRKGACVEETNEKRKQNDRIYKMTYCQQRLKKKKQAGRRTGK